MLELGKACQQNESVINTNKICTCSRKHESQRTNKSTGVRALQMTGWCQASLPDKQPVANNQWVGEKAEERTTCNFNGNKDGL